MGAYVLRTGARLVDVMAEHEGEFRLHLWLQQPVDGHEMTLGHRHVVEEHPEVGPVDSELALDGG